MSRLSNLANSRNDNPQKQQWAKAADYLWDLFTQYDRAPGSIDLCCKKTNAAFPGVLSQDDMDKIIRMARADKFNQSRVEFNQSNHTWGS